MRPYLTGLSGVFAAALALNLLQNVLGLTIPWFVKHAVDSLERVGDAAALVPLTLGIVGLAAGQGIVRFVGRRSALRVARRVEFRLRVDLFRHLQRLPLTRLDATPTGDLMSRATNDVNNLWLLLGPGVYNVVNTAVVYLVGLSFMLALDVRLTLYALLLYPVMGVTTWVYGRAIHPRYRRVQERLADLSSHAQENLNGIRVVKAYGQEGHETRAFAALSDHYTTETVEAAWVSSAFHSVLGVLAALGFVVVLWVGGRAVMGGTLTLGSFIAFSGYLALLTYPTIATGWIASLVNRAEASARRLRDVLAWPPEPALARAAEPAPTGRIEIRGLSFAYPGRDGDGAGSPALRDIDLAVNEGRVIGIVGPTGAGKSTLLHLIAGLYPAPPGTVLLGGRDVAALSTATLAHTVAVVPQDAFLFSDTIAANVAYARPQASRSEVEGAVEVAGLSRDVDQFADGLDTMVGERGITLSGGQRQRVALARALLSDARILLLDDVAASLDAETERAVLDAVRVAAQGRTVLVVSQKVSTVSGADEIVVLDGGRVVERGPHEVLLASGTLYPRLVHRQRLEAELAEM